VLSLSTSIGIVIKITMEAIGVIVAITNLYPIPSITSYAFHSNESRYMLRSLQGKGFVLGVKQDMN
jgi:hypothetical protein